MPHPMRLCWCPQQGSGMGANTLGIDSARLRVSLAETTETVA